MAIKKNELYSSLWASCDKLRGGMDASQYKDYILTLLFVKYVTDKFKGVKYADITVPEGGSFDDLVAWKGKKNIGEEMDKAIAKLAEANDLRGVIDNAHFNDESKLGSGQEMVDKLTGLIAIFQRPEFNFANNKAGLWRRQWQPNPVFLAGESHEQRSLSVYSPWGHKESNTTEVT